MKLDSKILGTLVLVFSASAAHGQSDEKAPQPDFTASTKASTKPLPSHVEFSMAAGSAQYSVLEMPQRADSNERIDGSLGEQDLTSQKGMLFDLKLGWLQKTAVAPVNFFIGGQQISSSPGSVGVPSSYARFNAGVLAHFELASTGTTFSPGLEARRSMYRNIDTGHYVDAVLVEGALEQKLVSDCSISVNGGVAPWTKFGVLQNSDYGKSGALAGTSAGLREIGSQLSWNPEPETSIYVGVLEETVSVTMNSTAGYQSYGAAARPLGKDESQKTYNMSVREFSVGASKRF
jgi:hypothetical protein